MDEFACATELDEKSVDSLKIILLLAFSFYGKSIILMLEAYFSHDPICVLCMSFMETIIDHCHSGIYAEKVIPSIP